MTSQATFALIEECRAALAEELSAWDIDPPLHHVKQAHDKCVAWLAATQPAPQPEAQASPAPAPLSEDRIIAAWNAQRKYHGGEPCKLGHLEFARAVESMVRGIGLDGGV